MKKLCLLLSCVLMYAATYAQTNSTLTIFSEDGHKFFLVLNGQRMNDKAETNIRLQGLTQSYYNCKVMFDDKTIEEVSKSYLPLTDASNPSISQDVTYKIKADKNGKQKLRFFSAQPIQVTATPVIPPDVIVYNYGTPVPVTKTIVTETTTTQSTNNNMGVNVNGMGINMNVNVTDPDMATHTTTTTTYTTTTTSTPPAPAPVVVAASGPCAYPMTPSDYQDAKASIQKTTFEETKFKTAKSIISNNCLYANQIESICRLFSFEQTKLDFAKFAYQYCYDKKNYFKVNDVFEFDASKDELSTYVAR